MCQTDFQTIHTSGPFPRTPAGNPASRKKKHLRVPTAKRAGSIASRPGDMDPKGHDIWLAFQRGGAEKSQVFSLPNHTWNPPKTFKHMVSWFSKAKCPSQLQIPPAGLPSCFPSERETKPNPLSSKPNLEIDSFHISTGSKHLPKSRPGRLNALIFRVLHP